MPASTDHLCEFESKRVAIAYQYLAPEAPSDVWYHRWGLDVLSYIGAGFEALGLHVHLIDVWDFLRRQPGYFSTLDYALTLVCGNVHISHWSVVPATAKWHGVKPLPATADVIVAGERKDIASLFAQSAGLSCPQTFSTPEELPATPGLYVAKPRDFGSSVGLKIGSRKDILEASTHWSVPYVYQEFVPGIDVTIPAIFDPSASRIEFGRAVAMLPDKESARWVFDGASKFLSRSGNPIVGITKFVFDAPEALKHLMRLLIRDLGGSSVARVDFRVKARSSADLQLADASDYMFIEINPVPTISATSNFVAGIREALTRGALFGESLRSEAKDRFPSEKCSAALIAFAMLRHAELTSKRSG